MIRCAGANDTAGDTRIETASFPAAVVPASANPSTSMRKLITFLTIRIDGFHRAAAGGATGGPFREASQ
jgi:hypothetical protein